MSHSALLYFLHLQATTFITTSPTSSSVRHFSGLVRGVVTVTSCKQGCRSPLPALSTSVEGRGPPFRMSNQYKKYGKRYAQLAGPDPPPIRGLSRVRAGCRRDGTSLSVTHRGGPAGRARLCETSISAETWRVGVLVMPSGAVLEGRGRPLQPKSAGLPGITRQRVGLPLKIFRLNSLLLLLLAVGRGASAAFFF